MKKLMLLCAMTCAACSSSEPPPAPPAKVLTTIELTSAAPSVEVNKQVRVTVTGRDQFNNVIELNSVAFSSSSASATVDALGYVTGLAVGTTTISATAQGKTGQIVLSVIPTAPYPVEVTIIAPSDTVLSGVPTQASAIARDQYGQLMPSAQLGWQLIPPTAGTISQTGVIDGATIGTVTLKVSTNAGTISASKLITIIPGVPTRLLLPTLADGAINGGPFNRQPVINVKDAHNFIVTHDNTSGITMTVSSNGQTVGASTITAASGIGAFHTAGIRGTVGSEYTLTFSSPGVIPVSQTITLVPFEFGTGLKVVGVDIPPAIYRSSNTATALCLWERRSGANGTPAEVIQSFFGPFQTVVEVKSTDKAFYSFECTTWETVVVGTAPERASFPPGMWIVNSDIRPGKWTSEGTGTQCQWKRLSGVGGSPAETIESYTGVSPTTVTIQPTDLAFVTNAECWVWNRTN